uniref:Btz domain-containing protein n=1 Tax=Meloidogyne javanica TaxID=6303 RepID=A0A915MDY2_MELJA
MKDTKEFDNNKEIGLMEQIKTESVKPPSTKKSNLTQEDMDLLGKPDVSKPAIGKQLERAGSMSLPRSLSPIQQQPKRAFSLDHKEDNETQDESEGSTEDDSNNSAIGNEVVEEQKQDEAVEEQNTVVEQKTSTGVRPEMMQEATKECSDSIVDSGHLNEKDGKVYVENYEVEIMKGLKNVFDCQKIILRSVDDGKGSCNRQSDNVNNNLRRKRGAQESRRVKSAPAILEPIREKKPPKSHTTWFVESGEDEEEEYVETTAHFDNYPPKKNHRYPMRGSKGPHFKAAVKGQYPYKQQRQPQFYHKQKVGYGAPTKWQHSVHFGYDPNEYGSNGYDSNEFDSEEYEHYSHGYNGRSRPMEGRNKNNYQQTPRITTKMTMNINNHRKETNKNEAKRSRGTVRFNLENNINVGEEKENQNKIKEKSENEKMEETKAEEVSEQKEVKQEKEEGCLD